MVKHPGIALFLYLIGAAQVTLSAEKLYVAPHGDDGNPGTYAKPLASLAGAQYRIRQISVQNSKKDTIYVHMLPGTYYLSNPLVVTPTDGGTIDAPVIYTAADETSKPRLHGGIKLDRFEAISPTLWRVHIPQVTQLGLRFEQLYINGQRRVRARTPNEGYFFKVDSVKQIAFSGRSQTGLFVNKRIVPSPSAQNTIKQLLNDTVDGALAVFHQKWTIAKEFVHYADPHGNIHVIGKEMPSWNTMDSKTRFYIENHPHALDAPGEWFLANDGYLYYIPIPGESITHTEAVVPTIDKFIIIQGEKQNPVKHLIFKNLIFSVSGSHTPKEGIPLGQAANAVDAAITVEHANNITFTNCEISNTATYALWFKAGSHKNVVSQCHFHDLGAGGIKIGTTNLPADTVELVRHITVDNNIIQHGGYTYADGVGIAIFHASDNKISHNDIADFRYSGISVGWTWGYGESPAKRNQIVHNHIHHLGWAELSDMGGIYTLGPSEGTVIANNVIHHVFAFDYGGWGIYTDEGTSHILIENNLVYRCSNAGYMHHYGRDNTIRNNIFALNIESQLQLGKAEDHRSFTFTGNIVYVDSGSVFNSTWHSDEGLKAVTTFDRNCYWGISSLENAYHGMDFAAWNARGQDRSSVIADPMFSDPKQGNFHLKSAQVARRIGFEWFDYTQSGVYGEPSWISKAQFSKQMTDQFEQYVRKNDEFFAYF
ncbi:Right handed beta helix region [Parapedobacter luteus]|uniref:Right handed beta helix region n=1 Tax=Parapedobacter luteus TaxID=623280 RepID=A0A1T5FUY3_9SPHI|nr:right-handed parallel beta-helix repeat-containing protein [Parapedobacter luteus]SKB99942.1 Right handed beta helix region [Parapedobacter luteus]